MADQEHEWVKKNDEWLPLDAFLQNKIREVSRSVALKGAYAQDEVAHLNALFKSDGMIGARACIDAAAPMITGKMLTLTGVVEKPDIDLELLQKDFIEGRFRGCEVVMSHGDVTRSYLMYTLEIDKEAYDAREVRALVEDAELRMFDIDKNEDDEDDEVVMDAFASLEVIKEPNFQEDVRDLREVYWDTSQDSTKRARTIGVLATVLLAHPDANEAIEEALGVIVAYSLEEYTTYRINGLRADLGIDDDGIPDIQLDAIHGKHVLRYEGMMYVDDFELRHTTEGEEGVTPSEGLQPAYIFIHERTGVREIFPLRFISQLNEEEYRADTEGSYEVASRRDRSRDQVFTTCGDSIRAYEIREATIRAHTDDDTTSAH